MKRLICTAVVIATPALSPAAAQVTSNQIGIGVTVFSQVNGHNKFNEVQGINQSSVPSGVVDVTGQQSDATQAGSASGTAGITASFAGASSGTLLFGPFFATATLLPTASGTAFANTTAGISYSFTVDTPASFDLTYSASEVGSLFSYNALLQHLDGSFDVLFDLENITQSGSRSAALTPGKYLFNASGNGTAFLDSPGTLSGTSRGANFSFNIGAASGAVPEPATWGMMILGFGAMGHAMRRRAKGRTAAGFA